MALQDDQIPPGNPIPIRTVGNIDVAQQLDGSEYAVVEKNGSLYRASVSLMGGTGGGSGGTSNGPVLDNDSNNFFG